MRIILELQGGQSESSFRGIRRFIPPFARRIIDYWGVHETFLTPIRRHTPSDLAGKRRSTARQIISQGEFRRLES